MANKKVAAAKVPSKAKKPIPAKVTTWDVAVGATSRVYAHFTVEAESFDEALSLAEGRMGGLPLSMFNDIREVRLDVEPDISKRMKAL